MIILIAIFFQIGYFLAALWLTFGFAYFNFGKMKYDRHDEHWEKILEDSSESSTVAKTWFDKSTLDYRRYFNMVHPICPLVVTNPDNTWLTVGDGRYGNDAKNLLEMGAKSVHATDISDKLLVEGAKMNVIQSFSQENAEALSFDNDSYDYVFCKEAFHHFPRPFIALDEMFRVARKGVVLIEPRDMNIDRAPFFFGEQLIRLVSGKKFRKHAFETVGNYLYYLSEKELEKFMLGMHHVHVATNSVNDVYFKGIEFVSQPPVGKRDKYLTVKFKAKTFLLNMMEKLKMRKGNILIAILFKREPESDLTERLTAGGFHYRVLPKNPYL